MLQASENRRLAMMCSEAAWTDCHRSMIADYLKARGERVIHIVTEAKREEHLFTRAANVVNGRLTYALPFLGT
jgi:uncharacterized protein (DUF488 family)